MGYNLQESLENTINTMGTLSGVHPIIRLPVNPPKISEDNLEETRADRLSIREFLKTPY